MKCLSCEKEFNIEEADVVICGVPGGHGDFLLDVECPECGKVHYTSFNEKDLIIN